MNKQHVLHPIPPLYDERSRVLILGSFPSVRSRETGFFYGHPRNRFWCVTAAVLGETEPKSIAEKRAMLLKHGIALWDVIASCEIHGSADSTITNAVPNDLTVLFETCKSLRVYTNGKTADAYYRKYQLPLHGKTALCLPSTSPAYAAWSVQKLCDAWSVIAEC